MSTIINTLKSCKEQHIRSLDISCSNFRNTSEYWMKKRCCKVCIRQRTILLQLTASGDVCIIKIMGTFPSRRNNLN